MKGFYPKYANFHRIVVSGSPAEMVSVNSTMHTVN